MEWGGVNMDSQLLFTMIDTVQSKIDTTVFNGVMQLTDPLLLMLTLLAAISIATNWQMFFDNGFNFGNIIIKILHIGFIGFLIRNWLKIGVAIKSTAEQMGLIASGNPTMPSQASLMTNSVSKVYSQMSVIFDTFSFTGDHVMALLLSLICLLFVLACFFRIVFTSFMVNAEFVIVGGLSIILLPFAITQWTKDIGHKPWAVLLTCSVKLLVVTFFMGMVSTLIDKAFKLNTLATTEADIADLVPELLTTAIAMAFLAYLIGQAVEFAGSIVNGTMISNAGALSRIEGIIQNSAGSAGNITRGTLSKIPFKKIGDTIRNKYGKYS